MTLEDETGNTNVVVWRSLQDRYRAALLGGKLLLIKGTVEKTEQGIVHLVAGHVSDHSDVLSTLSVSSRDFH